MAEEQANGFVLAGMRFKEQLSAEMSEQMDVHCQANAPLYGSLDLIGQLRGRFMFALSRWEQVRGAIGDEKGPESFQIKLEKADDIAPESKLKWLLVFDFAGRNDEVHDSTTS
jgi:hypothetical protein